MPALRKSARAAPHHRSSTTPYASPTGTPGDSTGGGHKRQSLMTEHWSEPAPQALAPSFEEHGFARHGVLETMAPLGVPPSAKVKQRARALGETAARNVAFGKGSSGYGEEVGSTPEVTPAPELGPEDRERHEEDEMQVDLPIHQEEEDDDYEPTKTKKKGKGSKTPVRGKTPVQTKSTLQGKTPIKNGTARTVSVSASPAVQPIPGPAPVDAELQRMHTAVNDAVLRANRDDKRRIGVALKELWEDAKDDSDLLAVMDAVTQNNPTDEQWEVFRLHVKASRKRQRNDAKLQRLEEAKANRQRDDPFFVENSSKQASLRASSEVVPDDSVSAVHDTFYQGDSGKAGTSDVHTALQASIEDNSGLATAHPFENAPTIPAAENSGSSTPRMSSKSPRKKLTANNQLAPESAANGGSQITPAGKTPESGNASDSELSDVNEEIVQKGPPETPQANGKTLSAAAMAAEKKAKSAAFARAAKKAKPNAGKLFGKHAPKQHQQTTAEQRAEEERAYELRKQLADQQPIRNYNQDFPVSDVRFDDEINDTESLTESQIAVGPPVDSYQPRRAGRVPNQGTKRLREDASRFSSPQVDLTNGTRPSTPAVGTGPKRIKLTHSQAARTKRSPVKNREGGPIAGVAFNGGGGSRQLGPDDNDPHSPQSESDDLCSACRGTGEFVCCEGCPRVFHLICCDPPRVDVPEGSFYCYECTVNSGLEENPAEPPSQLRSLFKALERINPRAFSLPQELQNAFEGVSARADGSYSEDVKKIPLSKNSGYGYSKPDYTKVFDADHKPILCTQCGVSSGHKRHMLKCDFCHAHWHLDCLDPPLANPPNISVETAQRDAWRCPRHIEHDLRSGLLLQNDLNEYDRDVEMTDAAPGGRVARKVRKPRNPEVVEYTFSRGMRNNGLIDVINDSGDDTDGEGNYVFGKSEESKESDSNSKVYRVPEKGIMLDFISKVKSGRIVKSDEARKPDQDVSHHKRSMQNLLNRPVQHQQAALNLVRFANQEQDFGLNAVSMDALLLRLTSEAPASVVSAMDNAPPPPVDADERAQLLMLQELIARRLNG